MIKIAAAADVHFDRNSEGKLSQHWPDLVGKADLFVLAGDLTRLGVEPEAQALAKDLSTCPIPVVAVLGNHDYHSNQEKQVVSILQDAGVCVLDNGSTVYQMNGGTIGVYGTKGFGGGFLGACGSDFGEPEMKAFIHHTKDLSQKLREGLTAMQTDYKVVVLHYSPVPETLLGEPKEIYPFLGSYLLAEAIDHSGANVIFHGHAHRGAEKGATPAGIPVRNVAQPVIRHAFNIYCLHDLSQLQRNDSAVCNLSL